jgi:tRNA(fMet)-specific endonuclease VapC
VTAARARGPIVLDTNILGADLVPGSPLTDRYEPLIVGRAAFISFQTAAELYFGALKRDWGQSRVLRLDAKLASVEIVHSGPELVLVWARLRAACERTGHALGQQPHDADRWVAATAIRLGVPLVSDDGIFKNVPGLVLETVERDE